jgi:Domain of unknown function (DUF4189)
MPYLKRRLPRRALCLSLTSLAVLLTAPVAAQAHWGAIAVNPATGATGVSFGYPGIDGAMRRASRECGDGCRIVVRVHNAYAALVRRRDGAFVAGVGETRALAFHRARERAHEQSARRVAWVNSR